MAVDLMNNLGSATITAGGTDAPAAGTVETWTAANQTNVPAASSTANPPTQFRAVDPAHPTEIMLVTNVNGPAWTVTRGVEGTTPVNHGANFTVIAVFTTAGLLNWLQANATAFDAAGAAATETARATAAEALLAPKASPALTGAPTAPTPAALDNSTKVATTSYADAAVGVETTRATAAEAARWQTRGTWTGPGTVYAVNDVVDGPTGFTGGLYRCITAHTSGATFTGAGVNWETVRDPNGTYVPGTGRTVSVTQYGAVGGNEAVDTAAFLAAVAAAGTYGRVLVPWANSRLAYILTPSTINLVDGLNIEAQGWMPKIQKGTGTGPLFSAFGVTAPRLAGLHMLGSTTMAGPKVSKDYGIRFQGCTDPVVEDCEIEGMAWDALGFDTWANVRARIRRNRVHDCANHGITLTSGKGYNGAPSASTDAEVVDNTVWNMGNFGFIMGYNRTPTGGAIDIGVDATLLTLDPPGADGDNVVPGDVGITIQIPGAGPAGAVLTTTIASYVDNQHVHITDAASTTVTGEIVTIWGFGSRYRVERNTAYNTAGPNFQYFTLDGLHAANNLARGASGGSTAATGHLISNCRNSTFNELRASNLNPTNSYGAGIYIVASDNITLNDPDVSYIRNTAGGVGEGIRYVSSGAPVTGAIGAPVFINRPKVYMTASHGIEVDGPDCHVYEHAVEGAGTLGATGWGILLNACLRPHILNGRRMEGNVSGGISSSGAVDGARVRRNEISNRAAVGSNPPALNISGTTTNSHFLDNDIHDIGTGTRYSGTGGSGTVIRDDIGEGGLPVKTVAGAVADASFTGGITPISGTLGIDTTNSKFYVRVGSTWKGVTVA